MVKTKKIRGQRRRWKKVDQWIEVHKNLDLEYLKQCRRHYAKIRVHPWSGISVTNSHIPEPKGTTKQRILSGLFEIYDEWKQALDNLEEPYYLKIWLFEPRFSHSQVVCAIGDSVDFYEKTFFNPSLSKGLKTEGYGYLRSTMQAYKWEYRLDEDHFDNTELGLPQDYVSLEEYQEHKKWVNKMMKKPHKTSALKEPIAKATEIYSFYRGTVWIGERNKIGS